MKMFSETTIFKDTKKELSTTTVTTGYVLQRQNAWTEKELSALIQSEYNP